jgi:hypothetical protein
MTAALEGGEGSVSRPGRSLPRERPGTHCTGGWVGPKAGLDRCGKSRPTGIRSPDRPARSQSLYRLSYPAQNIIVICINNNSVINNNYGRLQDLILLFKIPMRMQKNLLIFINHFSTCPQKGSRAVEQNLTRSLKSDGRIKARMLRYKTILAS